MGEEIKRKTDIVQIENDQSENFLDSRLSLPRTKVGAGMDSRF